VKWTGARETTKMNLERVSIILVFKFLVFNVDLSWTELVSTLFRSTIIGWSSLSRMRGRPGIACCLPAYGVSC
jgi:hypothetical protein